MKEFTHEHGTFKLNDTFTVREQLAYKSRLYAGLTNNNGDDVYTRLWQAALPLLQEWECEAIPDPKAVDVDKETSPIVADVVFFVGNNVSAHISKLGQVPKN